LLALGLDEDTTHYAIRIGIGRFNTIDEIQKAKDMIYLSVKSISKIN
jgi:cysteine sulfinate desulfinase/cysteine desulfurase-like protein